MTASPATVPAPAAPAVAPLAKGSISLGLHRHEIDDPSKAIEVMCRQARLAEEVGFDGVTLSEHHVDFPGYFPNPFTLAALVLERTERVWSGPLPLLLPLRPAVLVAEDLAWLAAAHPGRLAAGFAAGNQPDEHALVGLEGRLVDHFTAGLETVSAALVADGAAGSPLTGDPAVRAHRGGIPLVSAVKSGTATRRAARLGYGLLLSGRDSLDELTRFADEYAAAGGTGPRAVVVRAWAGPPPAAERLERARPRSIQQWDPADAEPVGRTVDRLATLVTSSVVDALNVRVHSTGFLPALVDEQIELLGSEVLPAVRAAVAAVAG